MLVNSRASAVRQHNRGCLNYANIQARAKHGDWPMWDEESLQKVPLALRAKISLQ